MLSQTIQKLPEELINQIKAGEVVERPASVVKELVENSIDAGSTSIWVELLDGGKQLIRITDNGHGIPAESLSLALERHATSKLKQFSDLEQIASFGFRGEALPSIASVSEFSIRSKTEKQSNGREITVSLGKIVSEKDFTMGTGTVIQAKEIFNNVPARLKFLKSTSTEYSHIYDFLLSMSFYYHGISFRLHHNGREIFHYKAKNSPEKRFAEILALESQQYAPVHFERGSFQLSGWSLLPEKATSLPQHFVTFVNGRLVKDKVIRSGVLQGYQGLLLKGLLPSSVIFLNVDPSWIDVNVHPAKIEVRFADPMAVQELIGMGIQNSLKQNIHQNLSKTAVKETLKKEEDPIPNQRKEIIFSARREENLFPKEKEIPQTIKMSVVSEKKSALSQNHFENKKPVFYQNHFEEKKVPHLLKLKTNIESFQPQEALFVEEPSSIFDHAKYLGQYLNCYLILEKDSELWIVDQHAFHERILFEEFTREYDKKQIPKQTMLNPMLLSSQPQWAAVAEEHAEKIKALGFELEVLTNNNLAVHTYPSFLNHGKIQSTIEELLQKILNHENIQPTQFYHLFYATLACHSAVRAGDALNADLVQRLLQRSIHVDFFAHCPHGRPVLRKFEKKDVESWFLRI